jgi:chemotaxis signal transduction protein
VDPRETPRPLDPTSLLRERAARYASRRRRSKTQPARHGEPVLVVSVGRERLAIPARDVIAVVRPVDTLALSLTPAHVPFAFPFRGEALLAVSLSALAGLGAVAPTPEHRLVVVRWGQGRAGLHVEKASRVVAVDVASAVPLGESSWLPADAVAGVLEDGVVLVNLEGLVRELSPGEEG